LRGARACPISLRPKKDANHAVEDGQPSKAYYATVTAVLQQWPSAQLSHTLRRILTNRVVLRYH